MVSVITLLSRAVPARFAVGLGVNTRMVAPRHTFGMTITGGLLLV